MLRCGVLVLVLSLVACVGRLEPNERASRLSDRLGDFQTLIRWGHFDVAAGFQLSQATADPVVLADHTAAPTLPQGEDGSEAMGPATQEPIRIAFFDVANQTLNENKDGAHIVSIIGYYRVDDPTLRQLRYRHSWWYHYELKKWFLDGPLPEFE